VNVEQLGSLIRDVQDFPQPGIVFKDISPLLGTPEAFIAAIDAMVEGHDAGSIDKVVGIEARGFLLAAPVAYHLQAGMVPVRKPGKLPGPVHTVSYALEYGSNVLACHQDAFATGDRVLVVDDVLATGGTAAAAIELVERGGATVVGVSVLLELAFLGGRAALPGRAVHALLAY